MTEENLHELCAYNFLAGSMLALEKAGMEYNFAITLTSQIFRDEVTMAKLANEKSKQIMLEILDKWLKIHKDSTWNEVKVIKTYTPINKYTPPYL